MDIQISAEQTKLNDIIKKNSTNENHKLEVEHWEKDIKQLDVYISDIKKEEFSYDYDKVEAESSKLRDSWISPLNLSYSYLKSNPYENNQNSRNAAIKMDQTIFASGGIYYGIKFAEASQKYS